MPGRSVRIVFTACVFLAATAGPLFAQSPAPELESVVPNAVVAGSGSVTITLSGRGFTSASTIHVTGPFPNQLLTPALMNPALLQVVLPSTLLANPATLSIAVINSDNQLASSPLDFYAYSPSPPVARSLQPAGAVRGTTALVSVEGSNLVGQALRFSGTGLSAQGNQITVAPDAPLGPQTVTISTPSGATSTCGDQPCLFSVIDPGTWSLAPADLAGPGIVVKLRDGRVLLAGATAARIFDPATNQWTATGSPITNTQRTTAAANLLPDGRVLVAADSTAEIYDPATGTWSVTGPPMRPVTGASVLLTNGKVLLASSAGASGSNSTFSADVFDPVTGRFQAAGNSTFEIQAHTPVAMELLADGRVLIVAGGLTNRIYDPATASLTLVPFLGNMLLATSARLIPDGRVLVRGFDVFGPLIYVPAQAIYDPKTNTKVSPALSAIGPDVVLADGRILISTTLTRRTGLVSQTVLYDPRTNQTLPLPSPTPVLPPSLLLDDGRALGVALFDDGTGNTTVAQIYTPAASSNPVPVIGAVISNRPESSSDPLSLDIRGNSFLRNSAVFLGQTKLVTLYLGAKRLVAFVPAPLRSSLNSGISVNNPAPGGGRSESVRPGFTGTVPLPISEVETGDIRSGYVIVTPDAGTSAPVATLTYGMVRDGIVQSQAAILPTPLTAETSAGVDVVKPIGRNLGLAIANAGSTSAIITLTLRDQDGAAAGSSASLEIPARSQLARFVTELFPSGVIGPAFQGSITIQSSVPVSVVGLRFSGMEFSTLPVTAAGSGSGGVPLQGAVGGANALMFPQFAVFGGWATTLGLVNAGPSAISGRIDIFDTSGNPLAVTLNGERKSTFTYSIPSRGSLTLAPRDENGQSPF